MTTGELQGLYQQVILDHAREKHGFGLLAHDDAHSHQVNPTCGDEITLQVQLSQPGSAPAPFGSPTAVHDFPPSIESVHWEGNGCSISQASASLLSDLAAGVEVSGMRVRIDVFRLAMRSKGTIEPDEDLLGDAVVLGGTSRYIARVKCAMLAWVALEDALLQLSATPPA